MPGQAIRYIDATLIETRAADNGRRVYRYRVSSSQPARDGGVIPVAEWRTDNFRRHPVVLAAHNYMTFPIGMADELTTDDDGLIADLALHGQNEASREAIAILDNGFPLATSVGFRAESIEQPAARGSEPYTFRGVELLEISLVAVPSDPNALAMRAMALLRDVPGDQYGLTRLTIPEGQWFCGDPEAFPSRGFHAMGFAESDLSDRFAQLEERLLALETRLSEAGAEQSAPEAPTVVDIDLSRFSNLLRSS